MQKTRYIPKEASWNLGVQGGVVLEPSGEMRDAREEFFPDPALGALSRSPLARKPKDTRSRYNQAKCKRKGAVSASSGPSSTVMSRPMSVAISTRPFQSIKEPASTSNGASS